MESLYLMPKKFYTNDENFEENSNSWLVTIEFEKL